LTIEILGTGQPDGTGVVKSATEKVNIYGETPVAQAAHIGDAADATGIDVAAASGQVVTVAEFNTLVAKINVLLDDLSDIGIHASA
jgi:hypothetical protein